MAKKLGVIFLSIGVFFGVIGVFLPFCVYNDKLIPLLEKENIHANLFSPLAIIWLLAAVGVIVFLMIGKRLATFICSIVGGAGILLSFFVVNYELGTYAEKTSRGMGFWCALFGSVLMIVAGFVYFIAAISEEVREENED